MTRRGPEEDLAAARSPSVTVVVPVRNESASIGRCLDSVLAQTFADIEVLVVDGDSEDATADVVRAFAARDGRVRLLANPRRVIPAAMNAGLAASRGRWLVRVDAHATIPPDYVGLVVGLLGTGLWGGVGGRKDAVASGPAGRAIAAAHRSRFGVGDSHYHYVEAPRETDHVPFGAYPVALCRAHGGWDETVTANEDYEFDYRVRRGGDRLLLDPAMRIEWQARESIPDLVAQYWRYGSGKATVARLHPGSLKPRHLAAPLLVAGCVAAAGLAPRRPGWSALLCAPYLAALGAASLQAAASLPDSRSRSYLPAAFATMHLAWGAGFWTGLLRPRRARPGPRRPGRARRRDAP